MFSFSQPCSSKETECPVLCIMCVADDYESHHFYEDKPQPATTTTSSAKSSKTSKTVQKTKPAKLKAVRDTGVAGTRVKEAEAGSGTKNRDQMRLAI